MRLLTDSEILETQGGHSGLGIIGTAVAILEIPHIIVGFIEFWNYFADWKEKGCGDIEEDDHFRQSVCSLIG